MSADDLSLEQVDERTVSLGQSGLTETNKSPLVMFTALAFSTDIPIYQIKWGKTGVSTWLEQKL